MDVNLTGGCLCGAVRFAYAGELGGMLGAVTVCHCESCRRAQGLATAVAPAEMDGFEVTQGGELIREYESSPGKMRAFCMACGSPLYSRRTDKPKALRLRMGSFDAVPDDLRVQAHTYVRGQPAWLEHMADAPWFDGPEPGRP